MLLTGLAFGLLPAIKGSRTEIAPTLKDRAGAVAGGSMLPRKLLVGTQVALSLLLLVGAGLFVRTLRNLERLGPGFPTDHLLSFSIDPSLSGYSDERTKSFYRELSTNLEAMPGISSVGLSTMPVLAGYAWENPVSAEGYDAKPGQDQPVLSLVSPNYFATLGIPILAGRDFTLQDSAVNTRVDAGVNAQAVINETFARKYFPGKNPIGLHIGLIGYESPTRSKPDTEVVGIVKDAKYRDLRETVPAQAYFPYLEGVHFRFMTVYLRTQLDPRQVMDQVRGRMRQFDPNVPITGLRTMDDQIGLSLRTERLAASLSAVFGGLATLLAVIGLYGVMAYTVMRRTREIGIRIALGALRSNVIAMVMREVFILIGAGLAAGFSLALALANLIRSQLFGLNPRDPLTFIGSAVVLALAAGSAGFIPALRASSVDPTTALRHE
jgi:predicted permease